MMHFKTNSIVKDNPRFALYRGPKGNLYAVDKLVRDSNKSIEHIFDAVDLEFAKKYVDTREEDEQHRSVSFIKNLRSEISLKHESTASFLSTINSLIEESLKRN